jgi:hypothetical protein
MFGTSGSYLAGETDRQRTARLTGFVRSVAAVMILGAAIALQAAVRVAAVAGDN